MGIAEAEKDFDFVGGADNASPLCGVDACVERRLVVQMTGSRRRKIGTN